MTIGSVNSPLSLQESQLLQILQQQSAFRAKAQGTDPDMDTPAADTGQNLPGGTDVQSSDSNLNPDLSPDKISALLLALQTQQASLDTTLLLGGASTSSSGSSLVDYLTGNNNVAGSNPLIDSGTDTGTTDANTSYSLLDYLTGNIPGANPNTPVDDGTDAETADTSGAQQDLSLVDYLA